ncbi:MAG: hypothetical protein FK730_09495 [Asgard group archaeon]|nr:hypothetical protein [Asgard group archaeon]
MMEIIGINQEKCIKCKECIKECGFGLYQNLSDEMGEVIQVTYSNHSNTCIKCGHCVAVCPTDAIEIDDSESILVFDEIKNPEKLIDYDTLVRFYRARRSIRRFRDKTVSKKILEAILEASRYSPSAHNNQSWEYLIFTDPEKIKILEEISINYTKQLFKRLLLAKRWKFLLPKEIREEILQPGVIKSFKEFIFKLDSGESHILYKAPVVIICCSSSTGTATMAGADVGIALSHTIFAAQTKGLGSCWIGFTQEALNSSKKNKQRLGIPKNMLMSGVLALGYPAVQYFKAPPREELNIKWNPEISA